MVPQAYAHFTQRSRRKIIQRQHHVSYSIVTLYKYIDVNVVKNEVLSIQFYKINCETVSAVNNVNFTLYYVPNETFSATPPPPSISAAEYARTHNEAHRRSHQNVVVAVVHVAN